MGRTDSPRKQSQAVDYLPYFSLNFSKMTVYLRYRRRKGGIWEEDIGMVRISYGGIFVD